MVRIESIRYDNRSLRLVLLEERWWIPVEDAASQLGERSNTLDIFTAAPENERIRQPLGTGAPAKLVSVRYLIRRLKKSERPDQARFRVWLKSWKIVSGVPDYSDIG